MDKKLQARLTKIAKQIEALKPIEETFLNLEASEKMLFAQLFLTKIGSIEEKKNLVYDSKEWRDFSKGFVQSRVMLNEARRLLELQDKAYMAEYLEYKIENEAIKRGVG